MERLGRELVDPLIREAERVRDERIVESADLVDAGLVFGTGFAPFRGGPLHFAANEEKSNVEVLRRPAVA
jgi:3-hydroxyacyl-CoA dehydrogenase/enoyl-CoA hydratase/3-hydroxybutyryl-CoA epimerase